MNNLANPVNEIDKLCKSSPHFNLKNSVPINEILQQILCAITEKSNEIVKDCDFLSVSLKFISIFFDCKTVLCCKTVVETVEISSQSKII